MRTLHTGVITETVERLCIEANTSGRVERAIRSAAAQEEDRPALGHGRLAENLQAAKDMGLAVCQDTGMAVVFIELGRRSGWRDRSLGTPSTGHPPGICQGSGEAVGSRPARRTNGRQRPGLLRRS